MNIEKFERFNLEVRDREDRELEEIQWWSNFRLSMEREVARFGLIGEDDEICPTSMVYCI